jgi:hypothetical protein
MVPDHHSLIYEPLHRLICRSSSLAVSRIAPCLPPLIRMTPLDFQQIKDSFATLKTREDVAVLLGLTDKALRYRLYGLRVADQYKTFELKKKSGGVRIIMTPDPALKFIQHQLHRILECVYQPKPAVHGFTVDRSIKSNADQHPKTTWQIHTSVRLRSRQCWPEYVALTISFPRVHQRPPSCRT